MVKYFLILNTVNLGQYFSRGLITPSCYIKGWVEDFQSKINNTILLTNTLQLNEFNCGIELEITQDENKYIKEISNGFYSLEKPFPITRIKNLYFENEKQKEVTILNIESSDAYIPKEIIKKYDNKKNFVIEDFQFNLKPTPNKDLERKQELFDKLLGGFALMKIAKVNGVKEYSDNYFNYLSFINYEVRNKVDILKPNFNNKLLRAIEIDNCRELPYIYEKLDPSKVNKLSESKIPVSKFGSFQFEKIDNLKDYSLALLATYGNDYGKIKKIDDFIVSSLGNRFEKKWLEQMCLYFGINQGYNAFKNEYFIDNKKTIIKFKLESELDYTIIESIYQYVFNGKKDNYRFIYLSWCPKFNNVNIDTKNYETIKLFDKLIITKKKVIPGSTEYLEKLFDQFSKINVFDVKIKIKEFFSKIVFDITKYNEEELKLKQDKIQDLQNKLIDLEGKLSDGLIKGTPDENIRVEDNQTLLEVDKDLITFRLKVLEKINQIGELRGIAKLIGIKNYKDYNKGNIKDLKNKIANKLKDQV